MTGPGTDTCEGKQQCVPLETRVGFFFIPFFFSLIPNPGLFQRYHVVIEKKTVSFDRMTLRKPHETHEMLQSKQCRGKRVAFPWAGGWSGRSKGNEASGSRLSQEIAPSSSQVEASWKLKCNHPNG